MTYLTPHRRKAFRGGTGFVTTWLTTGVDDTVTLPLRAGFTYGMIVDWGDGSSDEITAYDDAAIEHTYAAGGTQTITITGNCEAWYFNNGGDKLKFRTVESWGDVGFTGLGLEAAFYGCANATSFATEMPYYAVTTLTYTWYGCSSATSFPDVDALVLVTNLTYTWRSCSSATSFPDVDALVLVTSLSNTWRGCSSATSFPDVDALVLVDTLYQTWYGCSSATSFPDVDALVLVTNLSNTWQKCSATSFPAVDALVLVTTLTYTWYGCSSATSFPDVDALVLVTGLSSAWNGCTACTTVPVLPSASTALVTTTAAMQGIGSGLLGSVAELWNTTAFPNVTAYSDTFTGATGLTNYADIPDGWKGL